jgi:hypothetical protein
VHRLADVGECRSLTTVYQQGHSPFYHPCPAHPLMPRTGVAGPAVAKRTRGSRIRRTPGFAFGRVTDPWGTWFAPDGQSDVPEKATYAEGDGPVTRPSAKIGSMTWLVGEFIATVGAYVPRADLS